ncbi:MAG TPA: mechanosensitive ion channel protein, partial [Erythrobacter sp.]|nr:mechanosensitive ion channel protein [Erythrobacter sp.]HBM71734.1 mechanosensitive ion channel protein [Erythrobacter sp.]
MQGETPPAAEPTAATPAVEQAWNLAEPVVEESSVAAAEGAKEALSSQSETVGSVIDTVDTVALSFGDFRISLFDVLVVAAVIVGILFLAWFASRMSRRLVRRMTRLDEAQQLLVEKVITIIVWAAAFFLGIDLLGIDLT